MKELVRQKKLTLWKEVVEKVNLDFEGSRREFWASVGRRAKAKNRGIASLTSVERVSVTSTKGKLEVLQKHYEHLGRVSVDSDFDDVWKGEIESRVEACHKTSGSGEDIFLDKEIEKPEIAKCLRIIKQVVVMGC